MLLHLQTFYVFIIYKFVNYYYYTYNNNCSKKALKKKNSKKKAGVLMGVELRNATVSRRPRKTQKKLPFPLR